MTLLLGIDPGFTGALAWVRASPRKRPELVAVADMPLRSRPGQAELDADGLADLLRATPRPDLAIQELVGARPGQGAASTFRFGHTAGTIRGVLAGLGIPVVGRTPQVWRRGAGLMGGDNKDEARSWAGACFPDQAKLFARAKDHNRAEAALIALSEALAVAIQRGA